MIASVHRTKTVTVSETLPPCWIRRCPTVADKPEMMRGGVLRVGPEGQFHQALIDTVDTAREVVLMASFLLTDEKLAQACLRAAKRGVRVYALTASDSQVAKQVREDEQFDTRMLKKHKKLLDQLAGRVLLRSAQHIHAKFLVADPGESGRGWLSTANFNLAIQESVELGIPLTSEEVGEIAAWFSWAFWNEATHELVEPGRLNETGVPPLKLPPPEPGQILVTTGLNTCLRDEILRMIESAQDRLLVSTYGLEVGHDVVSTLASRAKSGVQVTVVTRPRKAVAAAVKTLARAGATVVAHDKLHAKVIISDDDVLVMTANLETQGLDAGFEVGLRLNDERKAGVIETLESWAEQMPWKYETQALRESVLGDICLAAEGLRRGQRTVIEEIVVRLDPVTAKDALQLEDNPAPPLTPPSSEEFPHRIRYEWEVHPPTLPPKARERFRKAEAQPKNATKRATKSTGRVPYDPPVYDHKGCTMVGLFANGDADQARKLANELNGVVVLM